MTRCSKCEEEKPIEDFYIYKTGKLQGKPYSSCKDCERNKQKALRNSRPEHYKLRDRKKLLKKYYNLTLEQYAEMHHQQDGRCAICGDRPLRILCVDHCHATGKIRGLLCSECNTALGLLEDNTSFLENAIKYLRRYNDEI